MKFTKLLLGYILSARGKGGLSTALLQGLLLRGLRRNPIGLVGTILLRKALAGNGRVFGMDLASRQRARMAWLVGLVRQLTLFAGRGAKPAQGAGAAVRRRLSR